MKKADIYETVYRAGVLIIGSILFSELINEMSRIADALFLICSTLDLMRINF